jgi:hypothetical protein
VPKRCGRDGETASRRGHERVSGSTTWIADSSDEDEAWEAHEGQEAAAQDDLGLTDASTGTAPAAVSVLDPKFAATSTPAAPVSAASCCLGWFACMYVLPSSFVLLLPLPSAANADTPPPPIYIACILPPPLKAPPPFSTFSPLL